VAGETIEPRYLGRTIGYARRPTIDPLETISEDEQRELTARARRRHSHELLDIWTNTARPGILDAVGELRHAGTPIPPGARSAVRALERQVDAVDRALRNGA
jgi:hypothetical protein